MTTTLRASLLTLAGALLFAGNAAAQTRTIDLRTGFMPDPQRFGGVSGGPVSAQGVSGQCRGHIPPTPSFILTTPTGFNFLRIFAESSGDTTLMVRGVSNTWCADDTYGSNPGVDIQGMPPGRYDIYVGSYSASDRHPYQLVVSELQSSTPGPQQPSPVQPSNPVMPSNQGGSLAGLMPMLRPLFGRIAVPPMLRRPIAARGRTNGVIHATAIPGAQCAGWVPPAPSHVMMLAAPMNYLQVYVVSAADSTLVVRRPDGTFLCNDDAVAGNLNPRVQGQLGPGLYQIWVGSYREGENRPYQLTVTSDPNAHP